MAPKAQQVDFLLSQVRNSTGSLASGTVTFYAAGTTTLKTIWTDRDEATPAANPYTLDANGTAQLYASGLYKVLIKNAAGTTIYTRDNLYFEFSPSDDIDALQYSPFTFTQATIAAALTAIGTSTKVTLLLRPGTWVISSNADWSAYTNVTWDIPAGAIIQVATGVVLNMGGNFPDCLHQTFSHVGTGYITFAEGASNILYRPQRWGAKGDATTNDKQAFNDMFKSARKSGGGLVDIPRGKYLIVAAEGKAGINAGGFGNNFIKVKGAGYRYAGTPYFGTVILGQMAGGVVFDFMGNEHGEIEEFAVSVDTSVATRPDVGILYGGALTTNTSTRGGANLLDKVSVNGQYMYNAIANMSGDLSTHRHVIAGNEVAAQNWQGARFSAGLNIGNPMQLLRDEGAAAPDLVPYDLTLAQWVKSNTTVTQTITGPDDIVNSASLITATGANGTVTCSPATHDATTASYAAISESRRFVTYIKRVTGTGTVSIGIKTGFLDVTSRLSTTEWTRVYTINIVTDPTAVFKLGTSGDQIAVWGSKLERTHYSIVSDYWRHSSATGLTWFKSYDGLYSIVDDVNLTGAAKVLKNRACMLMRGISGAFYSYGDVFQWGATAESPAIEWVESGQEVNLYGTRLEAGSVEGSLIKTDGLSRAYIKGVTAGVQETYPMIDVDYNYHSLGVAGANGYISNSVIDLAPSGLPGAPDQEVWLVNNTTGRASLVNSQIWLHNGISINLPHNDSFFFGNIIHQHDDATAYYSVINTSSIAASTSGNILVGNYGVQLFSANQKGVRQLNHLSATATLDFGNTLANTVTDLTMTVTGAAVGDPVFLGLPAAPAGGAFTGWVSATNTVTVRFSNPTAGAIDPGSAAYRATVMKY